MINAYNLCKSCKEKDHGTPMEELNVPHYRLRCSVALYINKALLIQEPRKQIPVAQTLALQLRRWKSMVRPLSDAQGERASREETKAVSKGDAG